MDYSNQSICLYAVSPKILVIKRTPSEVKSNNLIQNYYKTDIVGPTVTRPVQKNLTVTHLENRLCMQSMNMHVPDNDVLMECYATPWQL